MRIFLNLFAVLVLFSETSFAQGNIPQTQDSTSLSAQALGTTAPGEYPFTPEQDRRFYQALSQYIVGVVRFRFDAKETTTQRINEALFGSLETSVAARNMDFSYNLFTPNYREKQRYLEDYSASFNIPGVRVIGQVLGIERGGDGNYDKLLQMLGLQENLSSQIEYKLQQESLVDVWIISLESRTIKHLLSARQPEGTHTITWNGTNDDNVRMPCGYYIGQVFANKQRILQKGIRW